MYRFQINLQSYQISLKSCQIRGRNEERHGISVPFSRYAPFFTDTFSFILCFATKR
jgi:hypothetical protein